MLANDNVISIKTKKPFEQTAEEKKRQLDEAARLDIDQQIELLDDIKRMVAKGDLQGLVILGRHAPTGRFLTEIYFPGGSCDAQESFSYVGVLEAMKLEFADIASMAPTIARDGSIVDPRLEIVEEEADPA